MEKLKQKIETTVKAQSEVVSKEIKARQREIDARLNESVAELTEIMEVKKQSDAELEKKQVNLMFQSSLCEYLLMEVEG